MANNIVDIGPTKRLTKEVLESIKQTVINLDIDNTEGIVVIFKEKSGGLGFEAVGVDWALLSLSKAYSDDLRRQMLHDDEEQDSDE